MSAILIEKFPAEWINTWNCRDLELIMTHYTDEIVFHSPFIVKLGINNKGVIQDKNQLRDYFRVALAKYPDLCFHHINTLYGVNSLVIYYKSINNLTAAEYMELNEAGKIIKVVAHYI